MEVRNGDQTVIVEGCVNNGTISSYGDEYEDKDCYCGGIVGYGYEGSKVEKCENRGSVNGYGNCTRWNSRGFEHRWFYI